MATARMQVDVRTMPAPSDILRQLKSLFDPYRPELHYMRGPGPKWHAKHRPAAVEAHPAPGLFHAEA